MYRVALIQNESEMIRYGWADIRPMIEHINYEWASFTIGDLQELFAELKLGRYDGIIIATNACNNQNVRNILLDENNKKVLLKFLEQGGGLFVSFQMRLTDHPEYGFLPEDFDIAAINRKELGSEGRLVIPKEHTNHILYKYPHEINSNEIANLCLNNEFVRSLYRGYLQPKNNENYDILLIDDSYEEERPLLMCLKANFTGRIVVTSIPLDWQGHKRLLENSIRYVIEGQPCLAVVEKFKGTEFDFQYLISNLEVNKVPFSRYTQLNLDFSKILLSIHNTIILDPGWSFNDLIKSNFADYSEQFHLGIRLFFFSHTETGDPVLSRIGGLKSIQVILPKTITWIKSQYQNGRWGGSFWHTFDIIENLVELGIDVSEYKEEVLQTIEPHNIEGSYDEVVGATCALIKIYKIFWGEDHIKYKQSLKWLQNKFSQSSFYEQASVIDTFNELGTPLNQQIILDFRAKVKLLIPSIDDEIRLFRYAKTLLSCGYIKDVLSICSKLSISQSTSGKWVNEARTASILILLIKVQKQLGNHSRELDDMIFRGVTYLKSTFDSKNNNWHNDIPSTAKSIRVISEFEQLISYPIDEIIQTLKGFYQVTSEFKILEIAISQNTKLQKEKVLLKQKIDKEQNIRSFATKLSTLLTIISAPLFTLLLILLFYTIKKNDFLPFWNYFKTFLKDQSIAISTTISLIPITILYFILRAFEFIPRLKILPEEWENAILGLFIKKK